MPENNQTKKNKFTIKETPVCFFLMECLKERAERNENSNIGVHNPRDLNSLFFSKNDYIDIGVANSSLNAAHNIVGVEVEDVVDNKNIIDRSAHKPSLDSTTTEPTHTNTPSECRPSDTTTESAHTKTTQESSSTAIVTSNDTATSSNTTHDPDSITTEPTYTNTPSECRPSDITGEPTHTNTTHEPLLSDITLESVHINIPSECRPSDTTTESTHISTTSECRPSDTITEPTTNITHEPLSSDITPEPTHINTPIESSSTAIVTPSDTATSSNTTHDPDSTTTELTHTNTPSECRPSDTTTEPTTNTTHEPLPSDITLEPTHTNTPSECWPSDTTTESTHISIPSESSFATIVTPSDTTTSSNAMHDPDSTTTEPTHANIPSECRPSDTTTEPTYTNTSSECRPSDTITEPTHISTPSECRPSDTTAESVHTNTSSEYLPNDTAAEPTHTNTSSESSSTAIVTFNNTVTSSKGFFLRIIDRIRGNANKTADDLNSDNVDTRFVTKKTTNKNHSKNIKVEDRVICTDDGCVDDSGESLFFGKEDDRSKCNTSILKKALQLLISRRILRKGHTTRFLIYAIDVLFELEANFFLEDKFKKILLEKMLSCILFNFEQIKELDRFNKKRLHHPSELVFRSKEQREKDAQMRLIRGLDMVLKTTNFEFFGVIQKEFACAKRAFLKNKSFLQVFFGFFKDFFNLTKNCRKKDFKLKNLTDLLTEKSSFLNNKINTKKKQADLLAFEKMHNLKRILEYDRGRIKKFYKASKNTSFNDKNDQDMPITLSLLEKLEEQIKLKKEIKKQKKEMRLLNKTKDDSKMKKEGLDKQEEEQLADQSKMVQVVVPEKRVPFLCVRPVEAEDPKSNNTCIKLFDIAKSGCFCEEVLEDYKTGEDSKMKKEEPDKQKEEQLADRPKIVVWPVVSEERWRRQLQPSLYLDDDVGLNSNDLCAKLLDIAGKSDYSSHALNNHETEENNKMKKEKSIKQKEKQLTDQSKMTQVVVPEEQLPSLHMSGTHSIQHDSNDSCIELFNATKDVNCHNSYKSIPLSFGHSKHSSQDYLKGSKNTDRHRQLRQRDEPESESTKKKKDGSLCDDKQQHCSFLTRIVVEPLSHITTFPDF